MQAQLVWTLGLGTISTCLNAISWNGRHIFFKSGPVQKLVGRGTLSFDWLLGSNTGCCLWKSTRHFLCRSDRHFRVFSPSHPSDTKIRHCHWLKTRQDLRSLIRNNSLDLIESCLDVIYLCGKVCALTAISLNFECQSLLHITYASCESYGMSAIWSVTLDSRSDTCSVICECRSDI